MNDAYVIFKASGHIRFGLGGPPAQEINNNNTEFLPVFTTPVQQNVVYYRKLYIINTDNTPYYKWKIKAESRDVIVALAHIQSEDNEFTLINSSKGHNTPNITWRDEINYKNTGIALLEPQKEIGIWLKIQPKTQLNEQQYYTVTLTFEGYS